MRSDSQLGLTAQDLKSLDDEGENTARNSFSGHERNHLFVNVEGRYRDVSAVSGLDHIADGRAFARLDFDRDGLSDMVLVNANAPRTVLFENRLDSVPGANPGGMIALRLVGGSRSPEASGVFGPRDPYGAVVRVWVGERVLAREHRCGEGLGAQSSDTMIVGVGSSAAASRVEVRFPGGRTRAFGPVPEGTLATVYEDPAAAGEGAVEGVLQGPYRREIASRAPPKTAETRLQAPAEAGLGMAAPPLVVYTTMATWCASCERELPQLTFLRQRFGREEVALLGVPVDDEDTAVELAAYAREHNPAYRLLAELPPEGREAVQKVVRGELGEDRLPASVVTDAHGRVLLVRDGVPSLSQLRRLRGR